MSAMKLWPPNPGSTVITSTWSNSGSSSRYGSIAVPGLSASPARAPIAADAAGERRPDPSVASAWKVTENAPELGVAGRPAVDIGDHQVHVERDRRDLLQPLDHLRAERQVGHEVVVHHVDVHGVGGRDPLDLGFRFAKSAARMLGLIRTVTAPP